MTYTDLKKCIDCDAAFKRSRTDSTVRCPDCRKASRKVASSPSLLKMYEAKRMAYAARARHDKEAEAKYTAEYLHHKAHVEAAA